MGRLETRHRIASSRGGFIVSRMLALPVALVCYAAFFVSFVYLIGFIGAFEPLPTHVDKGMTGPFALSLVVNVVLIALFGLQHSIMARPAFKAGWTKFVPHSMERGVYCLATAGVLLIIFTFWHSIEGSLWSVSDPTLRMVFWAVFFLGWAILFISTWLLNHFELFGLAQAWRHFRGTEGAPSEFRTPLFYKMVRHPIYLGFFLGMWATPDMTYSHFLFASLFTIYIVIGISYEEKDLLTEFGQRYAEYRGKVGAFIPGIGKVK